MIDISGLSKAAVLAALYNAARPQGMGFLHYSPQPMSEAEAEGILTEIIRFDYLRGRVMKVDLSGDAFEERLYDRDNGQGAAAFVVGVLRQTGDSNAPAIQEFHRAGKVAGANVVLASLSQETEIEAKDNVAQVRLGYSDVQDVLRPAVERSLE